MRKPQWLKTRLPAGDEFGRVNEILNRYRLKTVCSSAHCPNLAECWNSGTATIMILGEKCTRHCRFCAVKTGNPGGKIEPDEPKRVAGAVAELGIKYLVLTSVDRDDLADLGAGAFARTVQAVKEVNPQIKVEVLTPDFGAKPELIKLLLEAGPDVWAHNIETVERLTPSVRDQRAGYALSLSLLRMVKSAAPTMATKSGLMLGLGEMWDEILATLQDLRSTGCDIVTIGQYLQPKRHCLPVVRYWTEAEFAKLAREGGKLGFSNVFAGPMVRSSYKAEEI